MRDFLLWDFDEEIMQFLWEVNWEWVGERLLIVLELFAKSVMQNNFYNEGKLEKA